MRAGFVHVDLGYVFFLIALRPVVFLDCIRYPRISSGSSSPGKAQCTINLHDVFCCHDQCGRDVARGRKPCDMKRNMACGYSRDVGAVCQCLPSHCFDSRKQACLKRTESQLCVEGDGASTSASSSSSSSSSWFGNVKIFPSSWEEVQRDFQNKAAEVQRGFQNHTERIQRDFQSATTQFTTETQRLQARIEEAMLSMTACTECSTVVADAAEFVVDATHEFVEEIKEEVVTHIEGAKDALHQVAHEIAVAGNRGAIHAFSHILQRLSLGSEEIDPLLKLLIGSKLEHEEEGKSCVDRPAFRIMPTVDKGKCFKNLRSDRPRSVPLLEVPGAVKFFAEVNVGRLKGLEAADVHRATCYGNVLEENGVCELELKFAEAHPLEIQGADVSLICEGCERMRLDRVFGVEYAVGDVVRVIKTVGQADTLAETVKKTVYPTYFKAKDFVCDGKTPVRIRSIKVTDMCADNERDKAQSNEDKDKEKKECKILTYCVEHQVREEIRTPICVSAENLRLEKRKDADDTLLVGDVVSLKNTKIYNKNAVIKSAEDVCPADTSKPCHSLYHLVTQDEKPKKLGDFTADQLKTRRANNKAIKLLQHQFNMQLHGLHMRMLFHVFRTRSIERVVGKLPPQKQNKTFNVLDAVKEKGWSEFAKHGWNASEVKRKLSDFKLSVKEQTNDEGEPQYELMSCKVPQMGEDGEPGSPHRKCYRIEVSDFHMLTSKTSYITVDNARLSEVGEPVGQVGFTSQLFLKAFQMVLTRPIVRLSAGDEQLPCFHLNPDKDGKKQAVTCKREHGIEEASYEFEVVELEPAWRPDEKTYAIRFELRSGISDQPCRVEGPENRVFCTSTPDERKKSKNKEGAGVFEFVPRRGTAFTSSSSHKMGQSSHTLVPVMNVLNKRYCSVTAAGHLSCNSREPTDLGFFGNSETFLPDPVWDKLLVLMMSFTKKTATVVTVGAALATFLAWQFLATGLVFHAVWMGSAFSVGASAAAGLYVNNLDSIYLRYLVKKQLGPEKLEALARGMIPAIEIPRE